MLQKIKNAVFAASLAAGSLLSGVAFAQEAAQPAAPTVTVMVSPEDVRTALTTNLSSWVVVGIGIGISVFIVYLGWRLLKRFTRG